MTDKEYKRIHTRLSLINAYLGNIGTDVSNLYYDDITMTDNDKKEMVKGLFETAYKLGLAATNLQSELKFAIDIRYTE